MKRLVMLCLTLLVTFGFHQSALAQTGIDVTHDSVRILFPDSLVFQLTVESENTIEQVTLQYGTNVLSCQESGARQPVDFDPAKTADLEWEWDLARSGAIPPGAEVWWRWEIEDGDGNVLVTERQTVVVDDRRHRWQSIVDAGVAVHWYEGDHEFGQMMLANAYQSIARLENELGLPSPESIHLWIYPTAADVRDAVVYSPEWTGGVAFPEYSITVMGIAPDELDWAAQVIPHELTHLTQGIVTFNCRGVRLPTWLVEGLARHAEGPAEPDALARLDDALRNGRLPSLQSLAGGFSAYSDGANLAYTQSGQVVRHLIETFGPEQMTTLLLTMRDGMTIDDALMHVYGFDTEGLDVLWRNAQGVAPTPTLAADALALQETPTLVPTLALAGVSVTTATETPAPTNTPLPVTDTPTSTVMPTETPVVIADADLVTPPPASPPATEAEIEPAQEGNAPSWMIWSGLIAALFIVIFITVYILLRHRRGSS